MSCGGEKNNGGELNHWTPPLMITSLLSYPSEMNKKNFAEGCNVLTGEVDNHPANNKYVLEEEVPTELKVLLDLDLVPSDVLDKHTTEDPAPGCHSRRRIAKMIYFKL